MHTGFRRAGRNGGNAMHRADRCGGSIRERRVVAIRTPARSPSILQGVAEHAHIEHVLGGAARADRLDHAKALQVPVAIADLDIDAGVRPVRREQNGRILAGADPAIDGRGRPNRALGALRG